MTTTLHHDHLLCYKTMPVWNKDTLPDAFTTQHNTQTGTWAKLTILSGSLDFALMNEQGEVTASFTFTTENQPPFIEPQQWHRIVSLSDDIQCQLMFYSTAEDYYHKKYDLTATHSEVINAVSHVQSGTALDLGCGRGRNALYLNLKGFDVTAWDHNTDTINALNQIIQQDNLSQISTGVKDLNNEHFSGEYDLIISMVVLMFLNPERIPIIIEDIQNSTHSGGYNLIVSAMNTDDYPCTVPFPFTLRTGELKHYYHDWNIIKYNEDVGHLHKTDSQGNRIPLRFATLLAQKKPS